jgi:hypothetical protein
MHPVRDLLQNMRGIELRMRQEIPLGESENVALEDGASALQSLLDRLVNVPTPAGPTPFPVRRLSRGSWSTPPDYGE